MLLVKFRANYADEFEDDVNLSILDENGYVEGYAVFTIQQWGEYKERLKNLKYPYEWYFGTNEFIEWQSYKDLRSCYTVRHINENECMVLSKLMGLKPAKIKYFGDNDEYSDYSLNTVGTFAYIEDDDDEE
jgi:hypothetical protein